MTAALDSWRAAVIWAHSAGTFSRRFASFGRLMWPLSATFHLIAAAAHADQLRVHEGAAIKILERAREATRRRPHGRLGLHARGLDCSDRWSA